MKEVYITSVSPAGSSGGDIGESVSMNYAEIGFDAYKPQETARTWRRRELRWNVSPQQSPDSPPSP